eukprot:jgi/Undpi1/5974/HiC_scaffold_2.g01248.m1
MARPRRRRESKIPPGKRRGGVGLLLLVRRLWFGALGAACAGAFPECYALFTSSAEDGPPKYCTVFTYMAKSGGSSVKQQLVRTSRLEHAKHPGVCESDGRAPASGCIDALYNSAVIFGHGEYLRIPGRHIGRQCEYFTIMRHPIDRLVSAFFSCPERRNVLARPDKWCGDVEMEEPMSSRLLSYATDRWTNLAFQQMMQSFVCPTWLLHLCADDPQVSPVAYARPTVTYQVPGAVDMVHHGSGTLRSYKAVGIAEHWELTMLLFDATVTSPVRHWSHALVPSADEASVFRKEVLEAAGEKGS